MKNTRITRFKATFAVSLLCISSVQTENLFNKSDLDMYSKSMSSGKVIQHFQKPPATVSMDMVEVNKNFDTSTQKFEINLGGNLLFAKALSTSQSGTGSLIWSGEISRFDKTANEDAQHDPMIQIVLVRNGSIITANTRVDGQLYKIIPLQNGGHINIIGSTPATAFAAAHGDL